MTTERLSRRRFAALLKCHGPALDAWPAPERAAALALLTRSALSRRRLADALAEMPPADAPEDPDLAMRLRAGMWQRLPEARLVRLPRRRSLMGGAVGVGALAASFLLGAWLGLTSVPLASSRPAPDLFASAQTSLINPDLP